MKNKFNYFFRSFTGAISKEVNFSDIGLRLYGPKHQDIKPSIFSFLTTSDCPEAVKFRDNSYSFINIKINDGFLADLREHLI